jgi:hypothetical protein
MLQVDHCFTRANKHLFYEPSNSTVVCSSCNALKHYHLKSVDRAIDDIVRMREGEYKFSQLKDIDFKSTPNLEFNDIGWIEKQIDMLENVKKQYQPQLENFTQHVEFAIT